MKKFHAIFSALLAVLMCSGVVVLPVRADSIDVSAQSAVLIEAESGDVVFAKNANERLPMASTTKIMTALVALEHGDITKTVTVSEKACGVEGSSIYLKAGEKLTLEDLLYALMLQSANDSAAAIAIEIAGSIDAFADMMNETAAKIGLTDTHFTNPHGLDDESHYTTAADLAKLTAYAMQNETFRTIVATKKYAIPSADGNGMRVLLNHNKLLRLSGDCVGVKTGFTKRSGRCLVSAAQRDGVSVIAVTLNAPNDWNDHLAMYELGFANYSSVTLAEAGEFQIEVPCPTADDGNITLVNRDSLTICLKNGTAAEPVVECDHIIFPPVAEGDECGRVNFVSGGKIVGSIPLYAAETVAESADNHSFGEKILDIFKK